VTSHVFLCMHNFILRRITNLLITQYSITRSPGLRPLIHRFSSHSPQPTMASLKRKAGPPLSASPNDQKKPKKDATLTSFFGAPKSAADASKPSLSTSNGTSASAAEPAPVKFDVDKWAASLTTEQRSLLKLEIETLHPSWLAQLKEELVTSQFLELKRFIQREIDAGKKIFPPLEEVYSW
jgi:uracil-DNA glycosylase